MRRLNVLFSVIDHARGAEDHTTQAAFLCMDVAETQATIRALRC
jgi:hypothetical protein